VFDAGTGRQKKTTNTILELDSKKKKQKHTHKRFLYLLPTEL
jgi:hypothetical protein